MINRRMAMCGVLACLVGTCAGSARGVGPDDSQHELDTIIYRSDLVIEGHIVDRSPPAPMHLRTVRVTAVYQGEVTVGQIIAVMGLDDCRKPRGIQRSDEALRPGDDLVMFLPKAEHNLNLVSPAGDGTFRRIWDSPSDVRLVVRGRVCYFFETAWRGWPTPPYIAGTTSLSRGSQVNDSIIEFRKELRNRVSRAADWHSHLDPPATAAEVPWLVSFLRVRFAAPSIQGFFTDEDPDSDAVSGIAAKKLASLGDFDAINEAIQANPCKTSCFNDAFATNAGRQFLLDRIADRSTPEAHRKRLARLLQDAWNVRHRNQVQIPSTRPSELANFMKCASLIAREDSHGDDDVINILLVALREAADPLVASDFVPAANILREFYGKKTTPEAIRYQIEEVMNAHGGAFYDALRSPCGPILTIATLQNLKFSPLAVNFSYHRVRDCGAVTPAAFLVIAPIQGGSARVLPSTMLNQWAAFLARYPYRPSATRPAPQGWPHPDSGMETFTLPAGLQPGRYRIFYRLMVGDKIISEGHGFETTLPRPTVAQNVGSWPRLIPHFPPPPLPPLPAAWPRSRVVGVSSSLLAIPALFLLRAWFTSRRQYRRRRRGLCPGCAYDLQSSPTRCPECGRPIAAPIERGKVRRCAAKISLAGLVVIFIATTVMAIRSFRICDCWTRTMPDRADSLYASRGSLVLNLRTTEGEPGWNHERADPAAFPRTMAESGDLASWNVVGMSYSSESEMMVVPLWIPGSLSLAVCFVLVERFRKGGAGSRSGAINGLFSTTGLTSHRR